LKADNMRVEKLRYIEYLDCIYSLFVFLKRIDSGKGGPFASSFPSELIQADYLLSARIASLMFKTNLIS